MYLCQIISTYQIGTIIRRTKPFSVARINTDTGNGDAT